MKSFLKILLALSLWQGVYYEASFADTISKKASALPSVPFERSWSSVLQRSAQDHFFRASFEQDVYSALRDKITHSSGKILVSRPHRFRFEILSPHYELYLNDGQDFWKYNAALSHAQRLNTQKMDLGFMGVLSNMRLMDKLFQVEPWRGEHATQLHKDAAPRGEASSHSLPHFDTPPAAGKNRLFVKFIPREDNGQKVLYAILKMDTAHIEELRILWKNGNQMRLTFSHFSNQAPQESEFVFRPPAGVVVDDARSK